MRGTPRAASLGFSAKCPFCPGSYGATLHPPAVYHTLPVCAQYAAQEPDRFLEAARQEREGTRAKA